MQQQRRVHLVQESVKHWVCGTGRLEKLDSLESSNQWTVRDADEIAKHMRKDPWKNYSNASTSIASLRKISVLIWVIPNRPAANPKNDTYFFNFTVVT